MVLGTKILHVEYSLKICLTKISSPKVARRYAVKVKKVGIDAYNSLVGLNLVQGRSDRQNITDV